MNRRKLILAGSGLGLLILLAALAARGGAAAQAPPAKPTAPFEVGIPTAQEVRNMLGVYGERVETTERDVAAIRAQLEETRKKIDETGRKHESGLEKLLQEVRGSAAIEPAPAPPAARFRTFEFEKSRGRSLHVPAGSFGEATLLTGVFAPTTGEPLPVLFRLDAALVGPRKSRIPLRGAFLVGKAQGDANSKRAVVYYLFFASHNETGRDIVADIFRKYRNKGA